MKIVLKELIEKWLNMVLRESNKMLDDDSKIYPSSTRSVVFDVKPLDHEEAIDNVNCNNNTIYFFRSDLTEDTDGDDYQMATYHVERKSYEYFTKNSEGKIELTKAKEIIKSNLFEQIATSKLTLSLGLGKALYGIDAKNTFELQYGETSRRQQTVQESEKEQKTLGLNFNSNVTKYYLSGDIHVLFHDYWCEALALRGKVRIYFDSSYQIIYENGLFKNSSGFKNLTPFNNYIDVSIVDIFKRLKSEPIIAELFLSKDNWTYDEQQKKVAYRGKMLLFKTYEDNFQVQSEDQLNSKKRSRELAKTTPSRFPRFISNLGNDLNKQIDAEWPEDKRKEALSKITKCDFRTFKDIWDPYSSERYTFKKNTPTDQLCAAIQQIDKDYNLNDDDKEKRIAEKIVEFMNAPYNSRFRLKLFEKITDLHKASEELNDPRQVYKMRRLRR